MVQKRWNIPVPKALDEALEEAIKKDTHISKSDFIRDVVDADLKKWASSL